MSLPVSEGIRLLEEATEEDREARFRAEWVALLPWMQSGFLKLMQWPDYLEHRLGRNIDYRPTEEIIAELERDFGRELV